MNKQLVKDLTEFAEQVAKRYSQTDREGNVNNEQFAIVDRKSVV